MCVDTLQLHQLIFVSISHCTAKEESCQASRGCALVMSGFPLSGWGHPEGWGEKLPAFPRTRSMLPHMYGQLPYRCALTKQQVIQTGLNTANSLQNFPGITRKKKGKQERLYCVQKLLLLQLCGYFWSVLILFG